MASTKKTAGAAARRTTLLIATRKGLWTLAGDAARRTWKLSGPSFPRPHRASRDGRSARRADDPRGRAHRPSRADDIPLDRPRAHVEGSDHAPGVQARQRPHGRPFVLAHARPRDRTRRLVRGHVAAGPVSLRRWWRDLGRRRRIQRAQGQEGLVRRRSGRHARRPEAAFGAHRPARSEASLHRHVERRRVRVDRRRRRLETDQQRASRRCSSRTPIRRSATTRTASGCIRRIRIASISRTTAASTASTGRRSAGPTSGRRCRSRWVRSASRWSCIRAIPTRCGCFRWTARMSGRGSRPPGSPRPTARSTAARRGSGRRPACRRRRRGGR